MKTNSHISLIITGLILFIFMSVKSQPAVPAPNQNTRPLQGEKTQKELLLKSYIENGFLVMEYLVQQWQGNAWTDQNKHTYTYDALGLLTEKIIANWQNNSWVNTTRYAFSYDSLSNKIEELRQSWQNGSWVNAFRETRTYDPTIPAFISAVWQGWINNGWVNQTKWTNTYGPIGRIPQNWPDPWLVGYDSTGLTKQLRQVWLNNAWENDYKWESIYNSDQYLVEDLLLLWENFSWKNQWRYTGIYDANLNLTSWLEEEWSFTNWTPNRQSFFTYYIIGNTQEHVLQNWDFVNWVNDFRITYTYDPNENLFEQLQEDWANNAWVNHWRDSYTYDANGNQTERIKQWWVDPQWVNDLKYSSTYDEYGNLTEQIRQNWANNAWEYMFRYLYKYISPQSCLPEGITFSTQEAIDKFQSDYPGCTEIEGDVVIGGDKIKIDDIMNLDGLSVLTSIGGHLSIKNNNYLESLTGLDNINAGSISDLTITGNASLSTCEVQSVCEYLASPNGEIEIHDNSNGCNSLQEVKEACGTSLAEVFISYDIFIFPNPFSTSTTIEYELNHPQTITITFFNQFGKQVDVIEEKQQKGLNKFVWTPENLADGIYYFRLEAGEQVASGKVVLML